MLQQLVKNRKSYFYIYQINFSDGTFYIGSRKSKVPPEEDINYWGSPATHKNKWKDQDLIKEKIIIKSGFKSYKSMRLFETKLIKVAWKTDKANNLNENCGGYFSEDACILGAKMGGKIGNSINKDRTSLLVQFIDPNGKVHIHRGVHEFCRNNNLDQGNIVSVLKGRRSHHKGWTAKYLDSDGTEFINVNVKPLNDRKKLVEFIDPNGNVYVHRGISEFCRNNNLNDGAIISVLKGRNRHHKGWIAKYLNSNGTDQSFL